MSAPPLTPLGTARARAGMGVAGDFPEALRSALAERDLPEELLWPAWELARLAAGAAGANGLRANEREGLQLLALAALAATRQGSTCVPLAPAQLEPMLASLGATGPARRSALALAARWQEGASLAGAVGGPTDFAPLIVDDGRLYAQRMHAAEERLAGALRCRIAAPLLLDPGSAAVRAALAELPAKLSGEQTEAVAHALSHRLTLISGGPGTGKTSIVVSLLAALERLGLPPESVALAAPTGKAAQRLEQSIRRGRAADAAPCPPARTLHRLLGYSPAADRWRHHQSNRLAEQAVIVDECSMIDLALMDQLVRAVRDDARLILLGDADQLPSVDAGAVFRDLVGAAGGARLTRSYRMDPADPAGRAVLEAARAIHAGELARAALIERSSADKLAFGGVELLAHGGAAARERFLDRWWERQVRPPPLIEHLQRTVYRVATDGLLDGGGLEALFDHHERSRLLCVTRSAARPTGADAVNAALHRRALDGAAGLALIVGEPVMMTRNDYERGLFNGDQGLVLRVAESDGAPRPMAVFRRSGRFAAFHLESLFGDLVLAYAITVHKAQGSEFDQVALMLPDVELPIFTRELLYTAVTRSRRSVVLVGAKPILEAGIRAKVERFCGLAGRL